VIKINSITHGDALDVVCSVESDSIDLIVVDPPYFRVKDIWWDKQWQTESGYRAWITAFVEQWDRVLKCDGSMYVFAHPRLAYLVEGVIRQRFDVQNHIVWKKTAPQGKDGWHRKIRKTSLRSWYGMSERIIFAGSAASFGKALRRSRIAAGLSVKELTGLIGAYGRVNNGGSVSNWEADRNIPSEIYINKMEQRVGKLPRPRKFYAPASGYGDVWEHPLVPQRPGKHPCEKPVDLLRRIISASSSVGDVVLDCFCGSGSTLEAAMQLKRQFIGVDIDNDWVKASRLRLSLSIETIKSDLKAIGETA